MATQAIHVTLRHLPRRQWTLDWREIVTVKMLRLLTNLHLTRILSISFSKHRLTEYFIGLENVAVVRRIFGKRTEHVLQNLVIEFTLLGGYMWINTSNGHLMIDSRYFSKGDKIDIYLDIIHELVHIRQMIEGEELFDIGYSYVDRPTEVEAYRYAVEEAKRIGMSDERICQYLRTEWMRIDDLKRLAIKLNLECKK